MSPTCLDWRSLPHATVAPLLEAEAGLWRRELDWDLTEAWRPIEPARRAGRLPGLVAVGEDGRCRGWACYLVHDDTLQVAMLVADDVDATRELVHGIRRSSDAGRVTARLAFVRLAAPGLAETLAAAGFDVAPYAYRARPLERSARSSRPPDAWTPADRAAIVRLCARSYAESAEVRAFAPRGRAGEWQDYLDGLIGGTGCGRFLPEASIVRRDAAGAVQGAVLTTALSDDTAHLAQVMVDPDARGRGLGSELVEDAMGRASALGFRQVTLLAAEANETAARLYDAFGFERRATFLAAVDLGEADQPSRLTSRAFATGGVSTRR